LYDLVIRTNFSFLQHAKVKPWPSVCDKQSRHARVIHPDADAVTRDARLCYFEYRIADPILITNANLIVKKSVDCKVFPELAESEIAAAQKALPVMLRIHLVDKHGTLLSTMTGQICLRITVDIEFAHYPSAINWRFPDRSSDSLAVP